MRIIVKTLKGEDFILEAQPTWTIKDIKMIIKQKKGVDVDSQKLIFNGRGMVDTHTLDQAGIKQGDHMVVMFAQKRKIPQQKVGQFSFTKLKPQKQQIEENIQESKTTFDSKLLTQLSKTHRFLEIRQVVRYNPNLIDKLIQQIKVSSFEVFEFISKNREQFQHLFFGDFPQLKTQQTVPNNQIQSIQRLAEMGFTKKKAVQAYISCGKNEQLAANNLLEQMQKNDKPKLQSSQVKSQKKQQIPS